MTVITFRQPVGIVVVVPLSLAFQTGATDNPGAHETAGIVDGKRSLMLDISSSQLPVASGQWTMGIYGDNESIYLIHRQELCDTPIHNMNSQDLQKRRHPPRNVASPTEDDIIPSPNLPYLSEFPVSQFSRPVRHPPDSYLRHVSCHSPAKTYVLTAPKARELVTCPDVGSNRGKSMMVRQDLHPYLHYRSIGHRFPSLPFRLLNDLLGDVVPSWGGSRCWYCFACLECIVDRATNITWAGQENAERVVLDVCDTFSCSFFRIDVWAGPERCPNARRAAFGI